MTEPFRRACARLLLPLGLAVAVQCVAAPAAHAFFVSTSHIVTAQYGSFDPLDPVQPGDQNDGNTGPLAQQSVGVAGNAARAGVHGGSTANLAGSASLGHLEAQFTGLSNLDPGLGATTIQASTSTTGFANLQWSDTFTVTSPTLAAGAPVTVTVHLGLTGLIAAAGAVQPVLAGAQNVLANLGTPGGLIEFLETGPGAIDRADSRVFSTTVGASFSINGVLQIDGRTLASHSLDPNTGGFFPVSTLDIDVTNSALFAIDFAADDGVSAVGYTADSGKTDYLASLPAAAVPAPPALLLFAAGIAWIAARRRR